MLLRRKGEIIILSSPSGAGKTTLVKKISRNDKISVKRYFKWAVNYLIPSVYLTFCAVYFVKYLIYGL